jgi:hypothetical protein
MCQVQTAHGATRSLDRPATEYPTCAIIPDSLHQVSYSCHGSHRCNAAPAHYETSKRDFLNETKVKEK